MAADIRVRRRNLGLVPMSPQAGFAALGELLDSRVVQRSVLPLSTWGAFFEAHPQQNPDPFFTEVRSARISAPEAGQAEMEIADRLRTMLPQARRRPLLDHLREQLVKVLGSDPLAPVASDTPLQERGLDSLMSVELRNLLAKSLRLPLSATVALDYPTLDALCDHLLSDHFSAGPGAAQPLDDAALIAALSDADAEVMLRRELESFDG
jgi:acyl carrier protein